MGAFEGKVAFVTGASSGIGEALAREFAREGADLVLLARREDRLRALADEVRALGRRALAVAADVTQDGDLERAVAAAKQALGGVDVAIANAGFGVVGRLETLTLEDYRRQLETNFFGVLRTIYATLPELKARRGKLAVIGSVAGHVPTAGTSAYSASKFAVRGLVESIHDELLAEGVEVTLVSPGFVATGIHEVDNRGERHEGVRDTAARMRVPVADAARETVRAIARGRRERVVTRHGKAAVFLYRHWPWLVERLLARRKDRRRSFEEAS
jgi:short-subunit dehydrogenase